MDEMYRADREQRDYEARAEQNWWRAVSGENIYKTNYRKEQDESEVQESDGWGD